MSEELVPTPTPRQTLSFLRNLLKQRGVEPKNKLGQNFLIDLNLLDLIVRTADLSPSDAVLEVGSGTGTLTTKLAEAAGCVVTVEIDEDFFILVQDLMREHTRVRVLHADVLRTKNELNPEVLAVFEEQTRQFACTRRKLVANLPYVVATPVLANLLIVDPGIERMVVMVQWEIAERLTAMPGTSPYGALAVLTQALADVTIVRRVGPTVFWPRPKVDSAIVQIVPNAAKRRRVPDAGRLRHFLRDLYAHRRKNLRGALVGWPGGRRNKAEVDRLLASLGIEGQVRAEDLDIEQHLRLCDVFG